LAEFLGRVAAAHVDDQDPAVYEWARDRSINLWYQWGSGATSGGDGTYRVRYLREAEERFAELDRRRSGR
jgi:hypothetical protein